MKQITQKLESPLKSGFSHIGVRFGILGFLSLGLVLTPLLGLLASYAVVIVFALFTAFKISQFQQNSPKSLLLYQQAMDKMYYNGKNAKIIATQLEIINQLCDKKAIKHSPIAWVKGTKQLKHLGRKLILAHSS